MTPDLFECYLCGRHATRALVVPVGENWRCKSGGACRRRLHAKPGSYTSQTVNLVEGPDD